MVEEREENKHCAECDGILNDDAEYLYKGKSHCEDCYRAVKKAMTGNSI
jgi:hypothetical protein